MRERATTSSLLIAISLCLSATIASSAQHQKEKEWTWKDRRGTIHSRADLDKILENKVRDSKHKSGVWTDLSEADLRDVNLRKVNLRGVDLDGANLRGADLYAADLSGADLSSADLTEADLSDGILNDANLSGAKLAGAEMGGTHLVSAHLGGADLRDAYLRHGDLSSAVLTSADLSKADLRFANLSGATFEPQSLPEPDSIAQAVGLDLLTYRDNPGPLTQLRNQFRDVSYREQERAITCALNRHDADPTRLRASLEEKWNAIRGKPFDKDKIMPFKSFIEGTFKWIFFDLTCQYGLSYGRPLLIVGFLGLLSWVIYVVFMHRSGRSGIYFVFQWWRGKSRTRTVQIRPHSIRPEKRWRIPLLWLRWEWRVLRAAMFFSLMSAFNIGFRDINFGRWLRLLTKREYDLKAVGWARTVSGFQSLLSVYLIALWVLTYFGRPFG